MPDVGDEGEDGIAVCRRIVVGQDDAHLVQITENGLSGRLGVLHPDDGSDTVPDLILGGESHDVLFADDIGDGRLTGIGGGFFALAAK